MKKGKMKSIKSKVLNLTFICIFALSILLIGAMIFSVLQINSQSTEIAKDKLLEQVKAGVHTTTQAVVANSLAQYNRDKDIMDEDELVDLILDNIRNTQYSDTGYYFVYMYDGTRLVAPENPSQEGKNLWDLTDEAGNKPVQEFIAQAQAGGGFVTYMWQNPATKTAEEKVSYVAPLVMGNTEVLVGTGTYLPMLRDTQEEMRLSQQNIMTSLLWFIIPSIAVFAGIIMLLMYKFFTRNIVKPLQSVTEAAVQIAKGDTRTAISVHSNDEIGQVAKTIDNEIRQAFIQIERNRLVSEKQVKYQTAEVDKLVVNLERLAKGELYCDMAVGDADEDTQKIHTLYSSISANLHKSVNTIKRYIEDISTVLGEMSAKNLNVGISADYQGDFVALKDSINDIVRSLSEVMLEINISTDQVASGTQQVSDGSQEISQGATEQASAIEELTASVTQIAEQTRLNAASANEASQLTTSAKRSAEVGNEQMKAMQQAMTDINESAASISKIIKVIDDIAFQTNILALNAAVEAARAGIHGKGFAVVAEEVRNLAARSANAAKETTDLIEGSIRKTEAGTKIANETADALASIVSGVEKAAKLVGEIAQASGEQASAIMQVNRGIEQMSQVVQTNSATSEEAAAAAEELSSQAELLKSMIGQFRLKSDNAEKRTAESQPTGGKKPQVRLSDAEFGKY